MGFQPVGSWRSDTRSYLISFNTLFSEDINNLVGGLFNEEPAVYGPRINALRNNVEYLDMYSLTGNPPRMTNSRPYIDPEQQYTLRLLALFNTAYNGWYTDDLEFGQSIRLGRALSVNDIVIEPELRADSTRYTQLTDPVTGEIWYAVRQSRETNDQPIYSVAYEYINKIKRDFYVGGEDGPGEEWRTDVLDWQPRSEIRMLEIMQSTAQTFGYAGVWDGQIF